MDSSKVPVTILYRKPGTQPPLFLAGSFSTPPWEPAQMDCVTDPAGEYTFKKHVLVDPDSEVQYKFRAGPGDWWILDEEAPIGKFSLPKVKDSGLSRSCSSPTVQEELTDASPVTDEHGHRNNVLKTPESSK